MSRLLAILIGSLLVGCLTPGTSDPSQVWSLRSQGPGPKVRVFLPAELRTPKVVALDASGAPAARDLDRWATPLGPALEGVISEQLFVGQPVRLAVVEFRKLQVNPAGGVDLDAEYRMTVASGQGGPDVVVEGKVVCRVLEVDGDSERERILAGYAAAAKVVVDALRLDHWRLVNGEVAKPDPDVTVPGK